MQNNKLRALIVEDEPFVRADLCFLLKDHPQIEVAEETETVRDTLNILAKERFDVVFLDVQIRGGSGFDVLDAVSLDTPVIFFTSYESYAPKAFEVDALDYLVKPVSRERLAQAVDRLLRHKALEERYMGQDGLGIQGDKVWVRTEEKRLLLSTRDILAVLSVGGNYTSVHTADHVNHTVRRTFREWARLLPSPPFERIHRQGIVNMHYLSSFEKKGEGAWEVSLSGLQEPLPVSRRCLTTVKRYQNERKKQ
jgi:two-component system, LytTR family, response regulator